MWSAPEVLKQPKKIPDATKAMDVYSFGVIMWEMFFETLPFDGSLQECIQNLELNQRPKIRVQSDLDEDDLKSVTKPIASLIRKCWAE